MPVQPRGDWINPAGKLFPTEDHFAFIMEHPRTFGWDSKDIKRFEKDPIGFRELVINDALGKGWIRVRGQVGLKELYFQALELSPDVFFNIKMALAKIQYPPTLKVAVEESKPHGRYFYESADWFYKDLGLPYVRNPRKIRKGRR